MKKAYVILIILGVLLISAVTSYNVILDGVKVGRVNPKTIDASELATIDSIKTGQPIQRQLDRKIDASNSFYLRDSVYVKSQVNAFRYVFALPIDGGSISSPADATNYYIGVPLVLTPTTAAGQRKQTARVDFTIFEISATLYVGTPGTNETYSVYLRKNGTTDYLLTSALHADSASPTYYTSSVDISITTGDTFELKVVTPTWATNPASIVHSFTLYCKTVKK